jgi:hypothetical protein
MVWWWTSSSWVSTQRAFGRCARGGFEEDGECAVGFRASDRTRLARVGGFGEMEARARADEEDIARAAESTGKPRG